VARSRAGPRHGWKSVRVLAVRPRVSLTLQPYPPYPNSCQGTSPHQQGRGTKVSEPYYVGIDSTGAGAGQVEIVRRVSNTRTIKIGADPSLKRVADGPGWSAPPLMGKPIRSTPYVHAFGDETAASLLLGSTYKPAMNVNLHPDGFLVHQLSEVFFGEKQDAGVI